MTDKPYDLAPHIRVMLINPVFVAMLHESILNKGLVAQYNRLTGANFSITMAPPKSAIEALIDQSTGFNSLNINENELLKFIEFVYENIWLTLPSSVIDEIIAEFNRELQE